MKKIMLVLLSALPIAMRAELGERTLAVMCNVSVEEVRQALGMLNRIEAECDAAWQSYYHVLPGLINHYQLKVGAEVGIYMGSHCKRILETTQVTKLYGIDPYMPWFAEDTTTLSQYDVFYHKVKNKLSPFGDRFTLIRNYSVKASKRFKDGELDFVFIDGDHSYAAVKQDLECWFDKVRSGGIVAGDDYATSHPGVPRAVNEFFGRLGLKVNICQEQPRIWWVIKP